ncbi:hypothetical protein SK128_028464, partial [Halocaridina rubra]
MNTFYNRIKRFFLNIKTDVQEKYECEGGVVPFHTSNGVLEGGSTPQKNSFFERIEKKKKKLNQNNGFQREEENDMKTSDKIADSFHSLKGAPDMGSSSRKSNFFGRVEKKKKKRNQNNGFQSVEDNDMQTTFGDVVARGNTSNFVVFSFHPSKGVIEEGYESQNSHLSDKTGEKTDQDNDCQIETENDSQTTLEDVVGVEMISDSEVFPFHSSEGVLEVGLTPQNCRSSQRLQMKKNQNTSFQKDQVTTTFENAVAKEKTSNGAVLPFHSSKGVLEVGLTPENCRSLQQKTNKKNRSNFYQKKDELDAFGNVVSVEKISNRFVVGVQRHGCSAAILELQKTSAAAAASSEIRELQQRKLSQNFIAAEKRNFNEWNVQKKYLKNCFATEKQQLKDCSSAEKQHLGDLFVVEKQQLNDCSSTNRQQLEACFAAEKQQLEDCSLSEKQQLEDFFAAEKLLLDEYSATMKQNCSAAETQQLQILLEETQQLKYGFRAETQLLNCSTVAEAVAGTQQLLCIFEAEKRYSENSTVAVKQQSENDVTAEKEQLEYIITAEELYLKNRFAGDKHRLEKCSTAEKQHSENCFTAEKQRSENRFAAEKQRLENLFPTEKELSENHFTAGKQHMEDSIAAEKQHLNNSTAAEQQQTQQSSLPFKAECRAMHIIEHKQCREEEEEEEE